MVGSSGPGPDPPPPAESRPASGEIVDVRAAFERTAPQTEEERAQARAFIAGKIDLVRGDPQLTDEQKRAAIAELEAHRAALEP